MPAKPSIRVVIEETFRITDPAAVGRKLRSLIVSLGSAAVGVGVQWVGAYLMNAPLDWRLAVWNAIAAGGGVGAAHYIVPQPVADHVIDLTQQVETARLSARLEAVTHPPSYIAPRLEEKR